MQEIPMQLSLILCSSKGRFFDCFSSKKQKNQSKLHRGKMPIISCLPKGLRIKNEAELALPFGCLFWAQAGNTQTHKGNVIC